MPSTENKPRILVFAGPNGSGKSTVTKAVSCVGYYINADDLKRTSHCTDLKAAQTAELLREAAMQKMYDFTFETVLSTERNLLLLKRAKEKGYHIRAVFVLTNNSDINVARVRARVRSGGHDVPEAKIRDRYEKSLKNLAKLLQIADETSIIDNSGDQPKVICTVSNGSAIITPSEYWSMQEIVNLLQL